MSSPASRPAERLMLWIDGVGAYLVCLDAAVTLGQPVGPRAADIAVLGDLSSRHARLRRDREGYLVEAIRETWVNGRPVHGAALLSDGCTIQLGARVRLTFCRPHVLSATARLEFASPHRPEPGADGVILMADSCVLGPARSSHVVCPAWSREVILYRHGRELFCKSPPGLEIDGRPAAARTPITRNSRIAGEGISFSLEDLGGAEA